MVPTWIRAAGATALTLTVIGIFGGIFMGGFPDMWKLGRASDWPWWYYALGVPLMGAAYLLFLAATEVTGAVLFAPFTWRTADNPWKRVVFYALMPIVGVALLIGPMWLVALSRG